MDSKLFKEYAELVSRFKSGDETAYEEIYKKSERMVYTICYGILNNEEDAFDAMQETYLTVYKKIDSLEDNKTFVSWLKRIATTKSLDAYKKKKGDVSYDDAVAADESLQLDDNLETLPDAYIMEKTKREALDKIIRDELTDVQYQTIHMHYYSQMSVEQIAEIMNCPVGTVKTRLKSSRAKIKEGVKKYEKENKDAFAATPTAGVPFLTRFFNASSDNLRVPNLNIATLIGEQASNVTPTVVKPFTKLASNDSVKDVAKGGLLTSTAAKIIAGALVVTIPVVAVLSIKDQSNKVVETVPIETSAITEPIVETESLVYEVETEETEETTVESEPGSYIREGDTVYFGQYEQRGGEANGPEPIEWDILDESDGHLLLISRYVLEGQPYVDEGYDNTWENSYLRYWLNNEFYNTAFDADQQNRIILSDIVNNDNTNPITSASGGNDTQDYVYILSVDELLNYYDFESWHEDYQYGYSSALITDLTTHASQGPNSPPCQRIDQNFYDMNLVDEGLPDSVIGMMSSMYWVRTPASLNAPNDVCVVSRGGRAGWDNTLSGWYCGDNINGISCGVRPVICIEDDT